MSMRRFLRPASLGAVLVLGALGGCVDSFGGSVILATLDPGVQTPAAPGAPQMNGRPPAGTHYTFHAIQYVYERDADGEIVVDMTTGEPVIESSFAFKVADFEVQPLIQVDSPCFIDLEEDPFPGLHSTQIANKLREQTGIVDPLNPPPEATDEDITDVLTADVRVGVHTQLQNQVRAVTSFSNSLPPGVHPDFQEATECVEDNPAVDPGLIPPPSCIGAESNAKRLELCEQFWALPGNDTYYEGNDKVFTLPRNGRWLGAVTGNNPKNAGFLGGVQIFVDATLADFDAFLMNWQYTDFDGDGEPDYPPGTIDADKSAIGFHYMEGFPTSKVRGVTNVPLVNRTFATISGEAAIFPALGDDNVQF